MRLAAKHWAAVGLGLASLLSSAVSGTVTAKGVVVKVLERTGDKLFEQRLEYPNTLGKSPEIRSTTPLSISFDVLGGDGTTAPLRLDQAFVSFQHATTGSEVALPAKIGTKGSFKLDVSRKQFRQHFDAAPGKYNVALVLGSFAEGGLLYKLGDVHMVAGSGSAKSKVAAGSKGVYGPKAEIQHRFAEPQRMPRAVVSLAFTGLVAAPLVALFGAWARLGVNFSNLQREPVGSVAFMGLVTAYLGLAIAYWVGVRLFPTLAYALALALPTYLTGQYALTKRIQKGI
ncbi:proteasome regulatory particle base subunit [Coemansia thaxteri]|nr:proteasome regulatory particle base subunit [Coemansia thaxteri]KAJ2472882.1 proteasome regulatory particle base subunit [Coemansia sp. RSA 2322]